MANKVIKTVIQVRRDTEVNWLLHENVIPSAGEPCLTLDGVYAGQVKFGDGIKTWGELPYVGVASLSGDGKTTVITEGVIGLVGAATATAGQSFRISSDGTTIEWFDSVGLDKVVELEAEVTSLRQIVGETQSDVDYLRELVSNANGIPVATEDNLGVVKSSSGENMISVREDGTMEVVSLNWNKLVQNDADSIVLEGGAAAE